MLGPVAGDVTGSPAKLENESNQVLSTSRSARHETVDYAVARWQHSMYKSTSDGDKLSRTCTVHRTEWWPWQWPVRRVPCANAKPTTAAAAAASSPVSILIYRRLFSPSPLHSTPPSITVHSFTPRLNNKSGAMSKPRR